MRSNAARFLTFCNLRRVIPLIILACYCFPSFINLASAQTVTNLYSFNPFPDGISPRAALVQGIDGNFYGTTEAGGMSNKGLVFMITPAGNYTNLYSFAGKPDGQTPAASLVQGVDSNFYSTAQSGGTFSNGAVFRISPAGAYTNLYSFAGGGDGASPFGALARGNDGNFYGTTESGGTSNAGTVFRITPGGTESNLYSFTVLTNGFAPFARLLLGVDGNFYGTTPSGGTSTNGTVFKITPAGTFTSLYSFGVNPDGRQAFAPLTLGSDGNFYSTTTLGGTFNTGTIFRISPTGAYTNLYSFHGPADGGAPDSGVLLASDGNFYGVAFAGGISNKGTLFMMTPAGIVTNLHSFVGTPDGQSPVGGLIQGSDGNLYGTTANGGTFNRGMIFKVILSALSSSANQISAIQRVGTNVLVSIPSVAGETYQLQSTPSMSPTNWTNISGASVTNSPGSTLTLTNFGGATLPQRFYRYDITP